MILRDNTVTIIRPEAPWSQCIIRTSTSMVHWHQVYNMATRVCPQTIINLLSLLTLIIHNSTEKCPQSLLKTPCHYWHRLYNTESIKICPQTLRQLYSSCHLPKRKISAFIKLNKMTLPCFFLLTIILNRHLFYIPKIEINFPS